MIRPVVRDRVSAPPDSQWLPGVERRCQLAESAVRADPAGNSINVKDVVEVIFWTF